MQRLFLQLEINALLIDHTPITFVDINTVPFFFVILFGMICGAHEVGSWTGLLYLFRLSGRRKESVVFETNASTALLSHHLFGGRNGEKRKDWRWRMPRNALLSALILGEENVVCPYLVFCLGIRGLDMLLLHNTRGTFEAASAATKLLTTE